MIPGSLLALAVGGTCLRFLWSLPAGTRRSFIAAAGVFLGGAIGVEMLTAKHRTMTGGTDTFAHTLLVTLEEAGEMVGVAIFLYGVLRYLALESGILAIELRLREPAVAATGVAQPPRALDVVPAGSSAL